MSSNKQARILSLAVVVFSCAAAALPAQGPFGLGQRADSGDRIGSRAGVRAGADVGTGPRSALGARQNSPDQAAVVDRRARAGRQPLGSRFRNESPPGPGVNPGSNIGPNLGARTGFGPGRPTPIVDALGLRAPYPAPSSMARPPLIGPRQVGGPLAAPPVPWGMMSGPKARPGQAPSDSPRTALAGAAAAQPPAGLGVYQAGGASYATAQSAVSPGSSSTGVISTGSNSPEAIQAVHPRSSITTPSTASTTTPAARGSASSPAGSPRSSVPGPAVAPSPVPSAPTANTLTPGANSILEPSSNLQPGSIVEPELLPLPPPAE